MKKKKKEKAAPDVRPSDELRHDRADGGPAGGGAPLLPGQVEAGGAPHLLQQSLQHDGPAGRQVVRLEVGEGRRRGGEHRHLGPRPVLAQALTLA